RSVETLIFNHRSSPALVRIQHVIAKALDAEAPEVISQVESNIDGDVAEIWYFSNETDEANQLASWISKLLPPFIYNVCMTFSTRHVDCSIKAVQSRPNF